MTQSFLTFGAPNELDEWRPRYWILAAVALVHVVVAATILTAVQAPPEPPTVQSVEIVTLPSDQPSAVVEIPAIAPAPLEPSVEQAPSDTKYGPREADRRVPTIPATSETVTLETPPPNLRLRPLEITEPSITPSLTPAPVPKAVPIAPPNVSPKVSPNVSPNQPIEPSSKAEPTTAPLPILPDMPIPKRVEVKAKTPTPILQVVEASPLIIAGERLKRLHPKALSPSALPKLPDPVRTPDPATLPASIAKSAPTPTPTPAQTPRAVTNPPLPKAAKQP